MKNLIKTAVVLVCLAAGTTACKKEYVLPSDGMERSETRSPEKGIPGMWVINNFEWHNREPNVHFEGYKFRFSNSGIVYAIYNNNVWEGKWVKRNTGLRIDFGAREPLRELNGNWTIAEMTGNYMIIRGLHPVDNSSQFVIFKRISGTDENVEVPEQGAFDLAMGLLKGL